MAAPWIQIYSNLITHRKTGILADELGLNYGAVSPNVIAAGMLVSLWSWAIQNAYDGDLSRCSSRCIADACGWRKKPELLVRALTESGYLDPDFHLHDWEEYTTLLVEAEDERRSKTRQRVAEYRQRKKNVTCNADVTVTCNKSNADVTPTQECYGNADVTPCNADVTPLHYTTLHYQSIDQQDINNNNNIYCGNRLESSKVEDIYAIWSRNAILPREAYISLCERYGKDFVDARLLRAKTESGLRKWLDEDFRADRKKRGLIDYDAESKEGSL